MRLRHARNICKASRVDDAMTLVAKSKIDPALTRIAERWGMKSQYPPSRRLFDQSAINDVFGDLHGVQCGTFAQVV